MVLDRKPHFFGQKLEILKHENEKADKRACWQACKHFRFRHSDL